MKNTLISCLMLHSVGVPFSQWNWRFLTLPWQNFEGMLRWLCRMGYRGVTFEEYHQICRKDRLKKERAVCLTFDDGYLDNWVYASVLLEKYKFCGTVFVSGDFINPGLECRPRWNGDAKGPFPDASGFLNVAELRQLDASGVLDVQAHAMTHTWYPCGPRIVDFRHPGDTYHWMDWNAAPQEKWRYLQPPENPAVWGEPVYEHHKAMQGPIFFPNPIVAETLRGFFSSREKDYFLKPDWRNELFQLAENLQKKHPAGHWEEQDAYLTRVESELTGSARILESVLSKKVSYLCWPGGGYSPEAFAMAARYYAGTTIGSADRTRVQGEDDSGCYRFHRIGPLNVEHRGEIRYLCPLTNALYIEERRTRNGLCRLVRGGLTRLGQWGIQ
ncbi:polysaccharide deacetylase family protein [Desulfosarcina sp. OttesenSCG-928-G10]|nr:polysaccharide deacetylase family protein [Desulfosarcina sp. OttesenSCG-928-G10]MDL2321196.1 polysaccharide deacetylase family protein [Desulfosarcina sp. OttesenSCG-928-B08]